MQDIRQSINYANYLQSQKWIVEKIDNVNYFLKKIPILGYILKIQRPNKISYKDIKILSDKYKSFQIIIEPKSFADRKLLITNDYKLSKSPYLPTKTIHINLEKSLKQITADFKKETRRCIRVGEKVKTIRCSSHKEIEKFHSAWKKSVNFMRFVPSLESLVNLKKSFPQNNSLFLTSHNKYNKIIGGAVFTRSLHDYCYYWYGFTSKEGRTSLSQYSLLYQGILWGKKMGCKMFDMEGIYDDRFPIKSWLGFTHFKKGFGSREILYPGCYTKTNLWIKK